MIEICFKRHQNIYLLYIKEIKMLSLRQLYQHGRYETSNGIVNDTSESGSIKTKKGIKGVSNNTITTTCLFIIFNV